MNWQIAEHGVQRDQRDKARKPLSALKAVVLLAGDVRTNTLRKLTGRASPSLPVATNRTVLDCWREQLISFAETLGIQQLPVRVLVTRNCGLTPCTERVGPLQMSIEYDPSPLRGTAGLMYDIAQAYEEEDQLLVTSAGQILFEPLIRIAMDMHAAGGDFVLGTDPAGVPSGMMLFKRRCIQDISPVGFCDLNEQALPEMSRKHNVRVARFDGSVGMSVRTLPSYLGALRAYHRQASGHRDQENVFEERWRQTFGIVEAGAAVGRDVVLHDSVVLSGARVEPGAVLVRSVVCPGSVVARDAHVVDKVVSGTSGISL